MVVPVVTGQEESPQEGQELQSYRVTELQSCEVAELRSACAPSEASGLQNDNGSGRL